MYQDAAHLMGDMTVEPLPNICKLRAPSWLVPRAVPDDERVESGYAEARCGHHT